MLDENVQVRVNSAGRFETAPDWSWDTARGGMVDFDLWMVLHGRGHLRSAKAEYDLHGGDCFLLRPGNRYVGTKRPGDALVVIAAHFDCVDTKGRRPAGVGKMLPGEHRRLASAGFVVSLLERVLYEHGAGRARDAAFWMRAVLAEIVRQERSSPSVPGVPPRQVLAIEQLCEEIAEHPEQPHALDDLAARMHCSKHHFARVFKACKGVPPGRFVIEQRIRAARALLQASDHPVGRVAELLGYSDVYFFSRQFRQVTGVPPSACRKG